MHRTRLSVLIQQELDNRGVTSMKQAARFLGVSSELVRIVMKQGRVPKDSTLVKFAKALGLDASLLIQAAHWERLPQELREDVLPVASPAGGNWKQKRKWPLSQEQCAYLEKEMRPEEIQLIRKARQLGPDGLVRLAGYIDFMFGTCRVPPPPPPDGDGSGMLATAAEEEAG